MAHCGGGPRACSGGPLWLRRGGGPRTAPSPSDIPSPGRMGAVSPKAARTPPLRSGLPAHHLHDTGGPEWLIVRGVPRTRVQNLLSPVSCSGGPLWIRCWTHAGRTKEFQVTCLEGEPFKHPLPEQEGVVGQKAARTPRLRSGLPAHHSNDAGGTKWLIVRGSPG